MSLHKKRKKLRLVVCSFTSSFMLSFIKVNESLYIVLFAVSGFTKKLFSIHCVNIYFSQSIVFVNVYLLSIFFSIDSAWWKNVRLPHIVYIVIN